jgi:hypothetical protein
VDAEYLLRRLEGSVALTFAAVFTGMSSNPPTDVTTHRYKRHRLPAEIIARAVWLYFRFPLSLRQARDLSKNGLRHSIHRLRARAISGRSCSLAISFFVAQAEPAQHASNARALHNDAALFKLEAQFVQRQLTPLSHTFTEPRSMILTLPALLLLLPLLVACTLSRSISGLRQNFLVQA